MDSITIFCIRPSQLPACLGTAGLAYNRPTIRKELCITSSLQSEGMLITLPFP